MMTEHIVPGGKGTHADAYVPDLNPPGVDETSEVDITYRHYPPIGDSVLHKAA
jgi:hypothetical protein